MQMLQRRHELRAVLKCYTWLHLVRVLPQAALLALGETFVAFFARDRDRVRAVAGAWRWNLRHRAEIRVLRRELASQRLFPDSEVRRLQVRGSARLSMYLSRLSHQGLQAANAVASRGRSDRETGGEVAILTGSVGLAFSEDADFDELDDLGRRAGRDRFGQKVGVPLLGTGRQRVVAVALALAVVAFGTRELFFGSLPLLGQLAPLPSWSSSWHHFFSGWQSTGVGTTAPSSPAFGLLGVSGTVLFGAMGAVQRVLLLGCIPLGAWGMSRLMRPMVSDRARVVAVVCYLGVPLPYGALGTGRWDGLVAYAAFPFVALALARAAGVAPYAVAPGPRWRSTSAGRVAVLGASIAVGAGFAPALVPMVLVTALAWEVGALLAGQRAGSGRVLLASFEGVGVALVLSAPWVLGTLLAGRASVGIFGLPLPATSVPGWGEIVRFAIGPAARSPITWLLVVGAALPLVLGRGIRLAWAARLWAAACASWTLALVTSRGDLGAFTPSESVVLVPAALAVAASVGLGISAFENDLVGREFGWRQVASVSALVFVAVGLLPVAVAAVGGRWDLPDAGARGPAELPRPEPEPEPQRQPGRDEGPLAGRSTGASGGGVERRRRTGRRADTRAPARHRAGARARRSGAGRSGGRRRTAGRVRRDGAPGPVARPLRCGLRGRGGRAGPLVGGRRDTLGQRAGSGRPGGRTHGPGRPAGQTRSDGGAGVREQRDHPGDRAAFVPGARPRRVVRPGAADVVGWHPVLGSLADGDPGTGRVSTGTVYAGYAPAGSFALSVDGRGVTSRPAFGLGGAVRHHQRERLPDAVPIPAGPTGRLRGAGRVDRAGAGAGAGGTDGDPP